MLHKHIPIYPVHKIRDRQYDYFAKLTFQEWCHHLTECVKESGELSQRSW